MQLIRLELLLQLKDSFANHLNIILAIHHGNYIKISFDITKY